MQVIAYPPHPDATIVIQTTMWKVVIVSVDILEFRKCQYGLAERPLCELV